MSAKPIAFCSFARDVLNVTLTPGQRVMCAVAFDRIDPRDLDARDRELASRIFGADVEAVTAAARDVLVMVKGARIGGTYIAALYSLWRALTADLSGLAPGEQASATIIAPDQRLARQALRYANGAAKAASPIAALIDNDGADSFTLVRPDGARVALECLPATRGGSAVRGRSLVAAVVSETAFLRNDDYQVSDSELFKALAPRVLAGGMIVLESTPWAQSGILHELFAQNHGDPLNALAAHCPTTLMRPDGKTLALVARERLRDPENAKREFDAEFLDVGVASFFDPLLLDDAIHLGATDGYDGQHELVTAGADFAFRGDSSALVVCSRDGEGIMRVECIAEERPAKGAPLVPSEVCATFSAHMRKHGVWAVMADTHAREAITEYLAKEDIAFRLGPISQRAIGEAYAGVRNLLAEGRLRLPNHARLTRQLRDCVGKTTAGGGLSIHHPRTSGGGHGDLVSALVNAVSQLGSSDDLNGFATTGPRRFAIEPIGANDWAETADEYREQTEEREQQEEWARRSGLAMRSARHRF